MPDFSTSTTGAGAGSGGGSTFNSGPYMTAAGGLLGAYGSYTAGKANRRVARFNAEYARMQAEQARQSAGFQEAQVEGRTREVAGSMRASQGASGTVVGAGTNRAALDAVQGASEMDKLLIEINARRQAYGYQVAAVDQTIRGDMASQAGNMGAIETLLNTGSSIELERDPSYSGARRTART